MSELSRFKGSGFLKRNFSRYPALAKKKPLLYRDSSVSSQVTRQPGLRDRNTWGFPPHPMGGRAAPSARSVWRDSRGQSADCSEA